MPKRPTITLPPGKAGLSPDEAAEALSISAAQLYRLMDAGEFVYFHIGRARRITAVSIEEYIERRIEAEGKAAS